MSEALLPARCAGCFTYSEPRPFGQTPEGWERGRFAPRDSNQGYYWCPDCVAKICPECGGRINDSD